MIYMIATLYHHKFSKMGETKYYKKMSGIRVFAKAEFTNLNSTKKVWILFVESEVEMDLRKRNRFSTKYLTGRKKTWVGIICGVVPQNLKILWNSWSLICGIPQYFLVRRIFVESDLWILLSQTLYLRTKPNKQASHRCTLKLFKIKFFLISEVNHSTLSSCVNTLGQLNVA